MSKVKSINAGFTLKIEDGDFSLVSEPDESIYLEVDETMTKDFFGKQDGFKNNLIR
jgi:hypothetical protein